MNASKPCKNDDVARVQRLVRTLQGMQSKHPTPERKEQIRQLQQALARRTGSFRQGRDKVSRRMKRQHEPRA